MTVRPGGSYWQIATEQLNANGTAADNGDIAAFTRALRAHNAPRLGYHDPNLLHPGDIVELVAVATPAPDAPAIPDQAVLVIAGSSYWQIATDHLTADTGEIPGVAATAALTDALIAINAPLLGYDDPTKLHPGDIVYTNLAATSDTPTDDTPAAPAEVAETTVDTPTPASEPAVEATTSAPNIGPDVDPEPSETPPPPPPAEITSVPDVLPVVAEPGEAPPPPATTVPAPISAPVASPQSLPAPSASDVPEATTPPAAAPDEGRPVAVLSGLTALAAAGLGLGLAARRLKTRRRCRPGDRPAPVAAAIEPELAAVAYRDVSNVSWMSLELRWLAHHLTPTARADMVVQFVQLNTDRSLEVAFTQVPPIAPPAGWMVAADRVWILPTAHDPAELEVLADAPPVLPALVTLGDAADGGQVYLNTEAAAGLNVTGDADQVDNWVRNAVWEIAGAALAERPTVRVMASDVANALAGLDDLDIVDASALFEELADVFADGDHTAATVDAVVAHQRMGSVATNRRDRRCRHRRRRRPLGIDRGRTMDRVLLDIGCVPARTRGPHRRRNHLDPLTPAHATRGTTHRSRSRHRR